MGFLQSPGISLDLASAGAGDVPQAFMLREQTDNITPTVVFANVQGRLSTLLNHLFRSADSIMSRAICTNMLTDIMLTDQHAAGAEGRVVRKFDLVINPSGDLVQSLCPALASI